MAEATKSLTMHRKAPHSVFRMRSLAKFYAEGMVTNVQHAFQKLSGAVHLPTFLIHCWMSHVVS